MTIGTSSLVVAAAMIIFALFYDKKQINVGTILYQIIYSFFVDVFTKIQHYTDIKAVNFIIMLLGIIIFSFGTGLYSAADFGRGSYEAVTFSLSEKNGWKIKIVRMVLDILMVVIGVLLGGKFGICTVATVLLSGPVIQATVNTVKKSKIFKTINDNIDVLHRYVRVKKKLLGLDEIHMYDLYVPVIEIEKEKIPFEESVKRANKALAPLGEAYLKIFNEGIESGWVDIYQNKGKRGGAYSWGSYDTMPYVLLNYNYELNDTSTLVHEMGHSIHSYLSLIHI
mgnify:CR=1 FL=1